MANIFKMSVNLIVKSSKKILVTGFEPFLGESINPSQLIIESLSNQSEFKELCDFLLLPVSYKRSVFELERKLSQNNFQFVLMLGQAGGRSEVSLEIQGFNQNECRFADEDGDLRLNQVIRDDGETLLKVDLPLQEWVHSLREEGLPVSVSETAGRFVCNHLYYEFLARKKELGLFVHVPYLPEQVNGEKKSELTNQVVAPAQRAPSMKLEHMVQIVEKILMKCAWR